MRKMTTTTIEVTLEMAISETKAAFARFAASHEKENDSRIRCTPGREYNDGTIKDAATYAAQVRGHARNQGLIGGYYDLAEQYAHHLTVDDLDKAYHAAANLGPAAAEAQQWCHVAAGIRYGVMYVLNGGVLCESGSKR